MSEEQRYTPGPWHWDSDPIKGDPLGRVRYRVTAKGKTITQCYYAGDDPHAEYDARLIASAPTLRDERDRLREALQGMLHLIEAEVLVRNTANDHAVGWSTQALLIVQALQQAQAALTPAGGGQDE